MNAKERALLIEQVKEQIVAVRKSVADYKELSKPIAPDDAIGRVSRMDAINNRSINEAALRKASERLSGLERILEQQNDKDLGVCSRCKRDIPMGRLLLMPESRQCVQCASR